jgi:hypothetical protein
MKKTCRGWSSGGFGFRKKDVDVHVFGVCTCSWHKQCVAEKRCRSLFADGGTWGEFRQLQRLVGRKLPRSWHDCKSQRTYDAKQKLVDGFEREFFQKCRPVQVTVEGRKCE